MCCIFDIANRDYMEKISIVLMGLDFKSSNLGCSALGYSFLNILEDISKRKSIFFEITSVNYNIMECENDHYKIKDLHIKYKSRYFRKEFIRLVKAVDFIFDFTGGDSFTDMYGKVRFIKESLLKHIAMKKGRLIMGPQTIGPFKSGFAKRWAGKILQNSYRVYVRDQISYDYVREISGVDSVLTTDVAFLLNHQKEVYTDIKKSDKTSVGINISGLMWNNGYTGNNEFGMTIDYKKYCEELIKYCIQRNMQVHLISHVIPDDEKSVENDYTVQKEISEKFSGVILSPKFGTPMEAKAYIAQMDIFIGSRMHATVAAFSMGVPVVAVSYSRKFQGLYNSVGYPYIVDAKTESTENAIEVTKKYIEDKDTLKSNLAISKTKIEEKNNAFVQDLADMFENK